MLNDTNMDIKMELSPQMFILNVPEQIKYYKVTSTIHTLCPWGTSSYSLFFIYVTPSVNAQDNLLRVLFTFYMNGTNLQ